MLVATSQSWQMSLTTACCLPCPPPPPRSVKEHAIRLAGAFLAPIVIMHDRGHIVPPLSNPHLAALRAFLTSIRDGGCPEFYRKKQQQQQSRAATLEPLDPPNPQWETEAEHITKQQQQRQQYARQQQQQFQQQGGSSSSGRSEQQGQYSELIKIDGQMGKVPQLASKM